MQSVSRTNFLFCFSGDGAVPTSSHFGDFVGKSGGKGNDESRIAPLNDALHHFSHHLSAGARRFAYASMMGT